MMEEGGADADSDVVDADWLLAGLHYAYPTLIFTCFFACTAVVVCTLQGSAARQKHRRQGVLVWLMLAFVLTYPAELLVLLAPAVAAGNLPNRRQHTLIGLLSRILVFGIQIPGVFETENPVWYPYISCYLTALVLEPILAALSLAAHSAGVTSHSDRVALGVVAAREALLAAVVTLYFGCGRNARCMAEVEVGVEAERQPLLQKQTNGSSSSSTTTAPSPAYGSTTPAAGEDADSTAAKKHGTAEDRGSSKSGSTKNGSTRDGRVASAGAGAETVESPWERRQREASEKMEKRLRETGNWFTYIKSFGIFLPYIWPVGNRALQLRAVLVGVCLLANNGLNVLMPRQMGLLTDSLAGANRESPWAQVAVFVALKLAASEAGLSLLRQWLWIPVEFYSYGAMSVAAYSHVLKLSSDFHDSKSSSDIMMAIQSGQSVSSLLDSVCFHAVPMLVDMAVAFAYLSATFGPYEGFITAATALVFLHTATRMISGLKDARRREVTAWFEEHYVRQAGIQGWPTVTSFNRVAYEESRYSRAVTERVDRSQVVYIGYLLAYALQYLVLLSGLLAGALLAVYQVRNGLATPGKFIMLLTYWAQLVAPLNFFAGLGKTISKNLIHAEQLLEIMRTQPTVVSRDGAPPLKLAADVGGTGNGASGDGASGGHVRFDGVSFSYDGKKQILKDACFSVPPGTTVAFVGSTGAGKSTILKLLARSYDVSAGSITIDGQDLREVDLSSLREHMGVVPQSPILFDDTVMSNVRYARLTATDEEVFEACKAACIHEQILGFSDGYFTRVGERGIKLSGGELQRLAIARAILKRPSIVLLDEATSSVDTDTEQKIQAALGTLCAGRTTFIVAHRLSTVMNAQCIMVVSDGQIMEKGSHAELIGLGGRYADLWSKQVFSKPMSTLPSGPLHSDLSSKPSPKPSPEPQTMEPNANNAKANGDAESGESSEDVESASGSGNGNYSSNNKEGGRKVNGSLQPAVAIPCQASKRQTEGA